MSLITEISRRLQVHDVDLPTVAAIGIVAFTLTAFLHEASHGAACMLTGGEARAISTTELRCEDSTAEIAVWVAGPAANILLGLSGFLAGIRRGPARDSIAYFLWLFASWNTLGAGIYMVVGALTDYGDWAYIADTFPAPALWRILIGVGGFALLNAAGRLACNGTWQPLLGIEPGERSARMRALTLVPIAAALVVGVSAGLLSPLQYRYSLLGGAGGALVLLGLLTMPYRPNGESPLAPVRIRSSRRWIALAAVTGLLFVFVLGRGVGSFAGYPIAR